VTLAARDDGPDLELIASLGARIDRVLDPLVPRDVPLALVGFPNQPNVGDSLIWLGQRRWLARHGRRVDYVCDWRSYAPRALERRIGPRGAILVAGGGNFGDVWPEWQGLRERVAANHPGHRIVQLPQSVHFRDPTRLDRARSVLDAHPDLHILCRDRRSLAAVQASFRAPALLCPDMAFANGPLARAGDPDVDLLVLGREDAERVGQRVSAARARVLAADWAETTVDARWRALQLATGAWARTLGRTAPGSIPLARAWEGGARSRVRFGRSLLSRARVAITDRLHAHVFATLLGIPHVVLDTGYGKIEGFWETWTAEASAARRAGSTEEAVEIAEALLRGGAG
jgi:exopolysaccharide biosynthesis protein PssK